MSARRKSSFMIGSTGSAITPQTSSNIFHLNSTATPTTASKTRSQSFARRLSSSFLNIISATTLPTETLSILVNGCGGSGKTLLLKSLQLAAAHNMTRRIQRSHSSGGEGGPQRIPVASITVPTVGVEPMSCSYDSVKLNFSEVGSALSRMWPSYYPAFETILFVIDASNFVNLAGPASELLALFYQLQENHKPTRVIIVLNKMDLSNEVDVKQIEAFLRLQQLCRDYADFFGVENKDDIAKVHKVSAVNGVGVDELLEVLAKPVRDFKLDVLQEK